MPNEMNYIDYLRLNKILDAQFPESDNQNKPAHDEMLFIIIHQTYELWFKQLLYEVESVNQIMQKPSLNDNSPELQTVVHRLSRCTTILKVLVHQIDIMETMTPMDFLDFRNMLRPASGFQSWQFKKLEALFGLKYNHRYGQEYYISQLKQEQIDIIKKADSSVISKIGKKIFEKYFVYDTNTYYEFLNKKGEHDWKTLEPRKKTKGRFVKVDVRYNVMINGYDKYGTSDHVELDEKLNITYTIDTNFLPKYVLHNQPDNTIGYSVTLLQAKKLFKKSGIKPINAYIKYDGLKVRYVWRLENIYNEYKDGKGNNGGEMEVLELDAFTGEEVVYIPDIMFGQVY